MAISEVWQFHRARPLPVGSKTLIMGIVNLTPDSFSGGGKPALTPDGAALAALRMLETGADIVDFGAESTRPGATVVTPVEEMERLGDVVARVRARTDAPLSVDTYHPETAAYVLDQGADFINDVSALDGGWNGEKAGDCPMAAVAAERGAHLLLTHSPGPPATMQNQPEYGDVVGEVMRFLSERAALAERAGVDRARIWIDPGFGFGKTFAHNRELLLRLCELRALGYPLAVGLSRKRMIADALGLPPGERLEASLALAVIASLNGAAVVRVHDVKETARALGMADAIRCGLGT